MRSNPWAGASTVHVHNVKTKRVVRRAPHDHGQLPPNLEFSGWRRENGRRSGVPQCPRSVLLPARRLSNAA